MRLWTFQAKQSIEELLKEGILTAKWERYRSLTWKRAYEWMRDQMETKSIDCKGNAPIWAWHSCGGIYGKSPTLEDASNLLSLLEIESGVQTIEFECPDKYVLLSSYAVWNVEVLDSFFMGSVGMEGVNLQSQQLDDLFAVTRQNLKTYDSIQATLPFLLLDWVVDIRPLKLEVGLDFEAEEFV